MPASAAVLLTLVLMQSAPPATPASVDTVRTHYVSAAFETALTYLSSLDPASITAAHEQYRALCLFALGRTDEGLQAFERLIRLAPLYTIPESELSPRMFTQFRDVRRRVLPVVVRELYDGAKQHYDQKQLDLAVTELQHVMRILTDPDAAADPTTFADLRQLTDGFLRLAIAEQALATRETAIAAAAAASVAQAAQAAATQPPPAPRVPARADGLIVTRIVLYSRTDREVIPPVELERFMPPWNPPAVMTRMSEPFRGELEIVVDEVGRVPDARMLRPSQAAYDVSLLAATRTWRFEPARLNGEPVKYRLTFEVVLAPRR